MTSALSIPKIGCAIRRQEVNFKNDTSCFGFMHDRNIGHIVCKSYGKAFISPWISSGRCTTCAKDHPEPEKWKQMIAHILLMTYGIGFHIILCVYPMIFKSLLNLGVDISVATDAINNAGILTIGQLMFVYLICDIGVSIAWYYMILKKKLNLGKWALICCPFSTLVIDFPLKAIPIQFFKDFTVAFESLGWLLMYVALAVMAAKMKVEKKNEVILIDEE